MFPRTKWSILYFLVTIIFTIAVLVLEALIFAWFSYAFEGDECHKDNPSRLTRNPEECKNYDALRSTIPTYMALFIFAGVYQICISFWALSQKNTYQLFLLVIFAFAMLMYSGIQYDQLNDSNKIVSSTRPISDTQARSLIIAIPCIIGAESLILLFLTWQLYREYDQDIFRTMGASLKLKKALRDYLVFETIILFDIFFFVGFTLQFVIIILETKDVEFGLTIAVIPVTIIVLIGVIFCMRKEYRLVIYGFIVLCFAGLAYFLYKLIRMYTTTGAKHTQYLKSRKTLTVFAAITIAFLIITIASTIKCMMNFGKGLKDKNTLQQADTEEQAIDLGGPIQIPTDYKSSEVDSTNGWWWLFFLFFLYIYFWILFLIFFFIFIIDYGNIYDFIYNDFFLSLSHSLFFPVLYDLLLLLLFL